MIFHVYGDISIRIGKISSLPSSIAKDNANLEKSLKAEKFEAGPTIESPGPILFIHATIEESVVSMLCSSKIATRMKETKKKEFKPMPQACAKGIFA